MLLSKAKIRVILLFLIFLFSFNSKVLFATNSDFIVARVNNSVITSYELEDRYRYVKLFSQIRVGNNEEKKVVLSQILDKMTDEELIRQEAKRLKIEVRSNKVEGVVEAIAEKKGATVTGFKRLLSKNNISFQNFVKQIESDLIWSRIVSSSLKSKIKISDYKIKEFFEISNINPKVANYKIAEIYIKNSNENSKKFIDKLHQDLINGANFEKFVSQFSQNPKSLTGGVIGWVSKNDISEKIYQKIAKVDKLQYTQPITLGDGFYIFKVIDKKISSEIDERDIDMAKNKIFIKELEIEGKSYLMNLKKNSFIEIYHDKLQKI